MKRKLSILALAVLSFCGLNLYANEQDVEQEPPVSIAAEDEGKKDSPESSNEKTATAASTESEDRPLA